MNNQISLSTPDKKVVVKLLEIEIDDVLYRLSIRCGKARRKHSKFFSLLKKELKTCIGKIADKPH
jgi:hypothetical protein